MLSPFNTILKKEMDRKEFLKHVGTAMLMVAGGGLIVQSLQKSGKLALGEEQSAPKLATAYGYGASVYGGTKN